MLKQPSPVGNILAGSWRAEPDCLSAPLDLQPESVSVLTSTGAGALAWNQISRDPSLRSADGAGELRDYARLQALNAARNELALNDLARLFNCNNVNALLFKGWAVARYYSGPHLRPMGDVDLCALPGRFDELVDFLHRHGFRQFESTDRANRGRVMCFATPGGWPGNELTIDLHERLDRFFLPPLEDVYARAVPLHVGHHSFLTLSAEDHLRLVTIHFLQDGGWRPLSLCDVAAMLETLPPAFDWDLCLGSDLRRRRWMACTLQLAHELLGAHLDNVPQHCRVDQVPGWLRATVLREWKKPFSEHHARPLIGYIWRHRPSRLVGEVLARWPNPIRSTVELDADFSSLPRLPYQLALFARRVGYGVLREVRSGSQVGGG